MKGAVTSEMHIFHRSDVHANSYPYRGKRGRGVAGWNPFPDFLICCSILKRLYLWWKTFDLLNKVRYILGMVAMLEASDVTNNGRHFGRHLGFYQGLEIRLKLREIE